MDLYLGEGGSEKPECLEKTLHNQSHKSVSEVTGGNSMACDEQHGLNVLHRRVGYLESKQSTQ